MGPSTVCNMRGSRIWNTSVGGQFGFGIFEGISLLSMHDHDVKMLNFHVLWRT